MKKTIKRVTVCVEIEPVERLARYLKAAGISVSKYFNDFIIQSVQGIDALKMPKNPSEMTLSEAALLIGRIAALPDEVKVKIDYLVQDARSVIDSALSKEKKRIEKKHSK